MRIGAHVRVGSGYDNAVAYAKKMGWSALQFFSGNPKTYRVSLLDAAALRRFATSRREAGIEPAVIHTSYLINLATEDERMAKNSLALLENDLAIAAAGEVTYVNTHLGSYGGGNRRAGLARAIAALESALEGIAPGVVLVLENSAGAGTLCGGTIEELGEILRTIDHPQLAVCLDTAHSWASGYAIDSPDGVERFFELVDAHVGLARVPLFHFNDTQVPLGGRRDRHHHIGEGLIGIAGFRALCAHPGLRGKTAILETPGEEADDVRNLQTIRAILHGVAA